MAIYTFTYPAPEPGGTLWVNGIEYDSPSGEWIATGRHVPEMLTNTPRRGEPLGSRDRRRDEYPNVSFQGEAPDKAPPLTKLPEWLSRAIEPPARLEIDSTKRKEYPIFSGVLRYFPDALAEVARLSVAGNDKHNPGEPLHWTRSKSTDELDCLLRHLIESGTLDTDGFFHDVKVAWRALANLQKLLERVKGLPISPGSRP